MGNQAFARFDEPGLGLGDSDFVIDRRFLCVSPYNSCKLLKLLHELGESLNLLRTGPRDGGDAIPYFYSADAPYSILCRAAESVS